MAALNKFLKLVMAGLDPATQSLAQQRGPNEIETPSTPSAPSGRTQLKRLGVLGVLGVSILAGAARPLGGRVKPGHDGTVWVCLFALLLVSAPAHATGGGGSSCSATLGAISAVPTVFYDPFDGVSSSVTFTVELKNTGSDWCTLALAIASSGPSSTRYFRKDGHKLRYRVETTDGDEYDNDIADPRGHHSVGAGKTKILTVKVKAPSGLIAPAGLYNDELSLRLFRKIGGGETALGSVRTASAQAQLLGRAQVNIAGASSSWGSWGVDELDFNTLTAGEMRSARVQVRATTGVNIQVVSQNKGKLKHKTLSATVPYALKLNGATMVLDPGPDTVSVAPPVSLDGTSYPMVVTIGEVSGRPSGAYKDLLTVTVTPQ